jgi:hypothetical protein
VRRLLTLATIVVLAGCAAPNTGSGPSGSPTDLPSSSASAATSPTEATPSSSPATGAIAVDHLARSTVDGLTVRAKPGTASAQLGTINAGQMGFVVAGPVSADGYAWYQLAGLGLPPNAGCEPPAQTTPFTCPVWLGWVADGQPGGQAWLAATTLPCAVSPMNVEALFSDSAPLGSRTPLERLACYGSTPIRVRGWFPKIPENAGLGGTCGPPSAVSWLVCLGLNYNTLGTSESAPFGSGIQVAIDPASGVTMPARGEWLEVVGHLDDPAARDCRDFGGGQVNAVLSCRSEFVAESVTPVAGPY